MTRLLWWVLAWFALCLGAAAASPLMRAETVCNGMGPDTMAVHASRAADDSTGHASAGMDCPLCLPSGVALRHPLAKRPANARCAQPIHPPPWVHSVAAMATPPPARASPFSPSPT